MTTWMISLLSKEYLKLVLESRCFGRSLLCKVPIRVYSWREGDLDRRRFICRLLLVLLNAVYTRMYKVTWGVSRYAVDRGQSRLAPPALSSLTSCSACPTMQQGTGLPRDPRLGGRVLVLHSIM